MSAHTAAEAVDAIIDDMRSMVGFRLEWDTSPLDLRIEIRKVWLAIIQQCLDENMSELTRQFREGDAI